MDIISKSVNKKNKLYVAYHKLPDGHAKKAERVEKFKSYEKILKNESNIFIDSYGNYNGYFPIYPLFGNGPKQR